MVGRARFSNMIVVVLSLSAGDAAAQLTGGSFGSPRRPRVEAPAPTGMGASRGAESEAPAPRAEPRAREPARSTTQAPVLPAGAPTGRTGPREDPHDEALRRERSRPAAERARSPRFDAEPTGLEPPRVRVPQVDGPGVSTTRWWGGRGSVDVPYPPQKHEATWVTWAGLGLALASLGVTVFLVRRGLRTPTEAPSDAPTVGPSAAPVMHVPPRATAGSLTSMLTFSVGVDGAGRAALQTALTRLAASARLDRPEGIAACVDAVAESLDAVAPRVRYFSAASTAMTPARCDAAFEAQVDALRGAYLVETVRGAMRVRAPQMTPAEAEGAGFVVLSLVCRHPQLAEAPTQDWPATLQALRQCRRAGWEALEVIWSPTDEGDRMSSAELEVLYPRLGALDAGVGRVVCGHCRAVGARELGRCYACGAPY